jgi:hypothetical protein
MKELRQILQQKEEEIQRLHREVEILRAAANILEQGNSGDADRTAALNRIPSNVEPITHTDSPPDRPKRAFP